MNKRWSREPTRNYDSFSCANCAVTFTPVWKEEGVLKDLCNHCGVFKTTMGFDRPLPKKKEEEKKKASKKANCF